MDFLELTKRRECGLSKADTAVVWRNAVICPKAQAARGKRTLYIFEEHGVLKNTARKRHRV